MGRPCPMATASRSASATLRSVDAGTATHVVEAVPDLQDRQLTSDVVTERQIRRAQRVGRTGGELEASGSRGPGADPKQGLLRIEAPGIVGLWPEVPREGDPERPPKDHAEPNPHDERRAGRKPAFDLADP